MLNRIKRIIKRNGGGNSEDAEREYRLSHGMKVGDNCHIYSWGSIDGGHPYLISIGNNVTISTNVSILTHDASTNVVQCGTKLGRVKIGDNVFIGTRTIILPNVTIGSNVVVGAGSVVTHNLQDDAVYAGVPARFVCSIDDYKEKYQKLRDTRPRFDKERPWYDWVNASSEEIDGMVNGLQDGIGFI